MFINFVMSKCPKRNNMPRPKLSRRVDNPPHFKGYRTIGNTGNESAVVLNIEEYEAIRLSDYLLYGQFAAAEEMGVSRSTYARIYESARRKVSAAFVEGRPIVFEGGKVHFDSEWYKCRDCGSIFNHPGKGEPVKNCSLCKSEHFSQYSEVNEPKGSNVSEISNIKGGRGRECKGQCRGRQGRKE